MKLTMICLRHLANARYCEGRTPPLMPSREAPPLLFPEASCEGSPFSPDTTESIARSRRGFIRARHEEEGDGTSRGPSFLARLSIIAPSLTRVDVHQTTGQRTRARPENVCVLASGGREVAGLETLLRHHSQHKERAALASWHQVLYGFAVY